MKTINYKKEVARRVVIDKGVERIQITVDKKNYL